MVSWKRNRNLVAAPYPLQGSEILLHLNDFMNPGVTTTTRLVERGSLDPPREANILRTPQVVLTR